VQAEASQAAEKGRFEHVENEKWRALIFVISWWLSPPLPPTWGRCLMCFTGKVQSYKDSVTRLVLHVSLRFEGRQGLGGFFFTLHRGGRQSKKDCCRRFVLLARLRFQKRQSWENCM
jgi:hypothetical protein